MHFTHRSSYDAVPYHGHPYAQSHPSRLATIATLFGMEPQPVNCCRVLEIGCARGENLLPMADAFPQSQFVGIDLSAVQIATAQSTVDELQLTNVRLFNTDLAAIPSEFGEFDFVVAHGVYSWVSDDVQQALLNACHRHLAPQGVAYVSYNTFPGWHMRGMIRDMMNYHVRSLASPAARIEQSRAFLEFLAKSLAAENSAYSILLNHELHVLRQQDDSYLFHEHLEDHNSPVYFHDFAERAGAAGLQYLGEADFSTMFLETFPERVESVLRRISSTLVEGEQYMDFVRNRTFRQTLLCQKTVTLDRSLSMDRIASMYVASPSRPDEPVVDLSARSDVKFRSGASVAETSDPLTKAALLYLGDHWPKYCEFPEILESSQRRVGLDPIESAEQKQTLARSILASYANGHVELAILPPAIESMVTDKPLATRLARYQARRQFVVTSLLHTDLELPEYERHLLSMLDGHHDFPSIVDHLAGLIDNGTFVLTNDKGPVNDRQEVRRIAEEATRTALARFANCGLLMG